MRIKTSWDKFESIINVQIKPNRNEAIAAIKEYWLMECNSLERGKSYTQAEDISLIRWVYCDHQADDFERIERLARKSPKHHLYARNVIRYGIENNSPVVRSESAMQLINTLLDDNLRPKKQGKLKIVGSINERRQICFILRILLFKMKREASKIKRLTYLDKPAKIMRPRCKFIVRHSVMVKRNLYTAATNSPSTNNAFDIISVATGLTFDVIKNAWKAYQKEEKRLLKRVFKV